MQTHRLRGVEIGAESHPSILLQLQLPTEYVNSSDVFYFSVSGTKMKVIFTVFTNLISRENLFQYKILTFIKFQVTFSSDTDWVTYLTKKKINKTYVASSIFNFLEFCGVRLLPLDMLQNSKSTKVEKWSRSHIQLEKSQWFRRKHCVIFSTIPFADDAAVLLPNIQPLNGEVTKSWTAVDENELTANAAESKMISDCGLTLVLRKSLVCCSLKFRNAEFLSTPSHTERTDRCILRNNVWQLQFHPTKTNQAFNNGHSHLGTLERVHYRVNSL